jgi:hypothetical protein
MDLDKYSLNYINDNIVRLYKDTGIMLGFYSSLLKSSYREIRLLEVSSRVILSVI